MAAKTNSTNEVEFPLGVLLLHVSRVSFAANWTEKTMGRRDLAYWQSGAWMSVPYRVLVALSCFAKKTVCLRLSSPQAIDARWLRYWKGFTDAVKN